jgi:hypothetical protein
MTRVQDCTIEDVRAFHQWFRPQEISFQRIPQRKLNDENLEIKKGQAE